MSDRMHGDTTASGGGYGSNGPTLADDLEAIRNLTYDGDSVADRLAAYIERLEGDVVQAREDGWIAGRYEQRNLDAADRDQHKAEAERWERVARVLATTTHEYQESHPHMQFVLDPDGWIEWAEKEADK